MNADTRRWLAVCLIPAALMLWSALNPAADAKAHLLNSIILSCACVFLFKYILFAAVAAHLRGDAPAKRQALLQLLPNTAFAAYIVWTIAG